MFKIFGIPIYEGELVLPPASHIQITEAIKKLKMAHPPAWFRNINSTENKSFCKGFGFKF